MNFKSFIIFILVLSIAVVTGCTFLVKGYYADTIQAESGTVIVEGIENEVLIRRDNMGVPFIEASTMEDLAFGIGYANAADRLSQMVSIKLLSQGRLSEMAGPAALDLDYYMRSINLRKAAEVLYDSASDRLKDLLGIYSNGVNQYIEDNIDNLPPGIHISGYTPDEWTPQDSITLFVFLTLSLACNLFEEIDMLNIIQAIGYEKAAWLSPIYPDEPIPFREFEKLSGINLKNIEKDINALLSAGRSLSDILMAGNAASNNWVISKKRTLKKKSILANDTHLPILMPSIWQMIHVRCPEIDAAGVGLAGLPSVVAGYNGKIAWGMTMVMADNQDLFIEKLKRINNELHYLYKDRWIRVDKREEVFKIKGDDPVTKTIYETVHGVLLNSALMKSGSDELSPSAVDLPFGIALSWAMFEPDRSLDAFFKLNKAGSLAEAMKLFKEIRGIPLNIVCADSDNIGWQVTGRYPVRKKGRGLAVSPGWTGEYDWRGFLDVKNHPFKVNPREGYICTANNRTVPADYPHTLTSSWQYPERAERINQMILGIERHTLDTTVKMHKDTVSLYFLKVKEEILKGASLKKIEDEINNWQDKNRRAGALKAIEILQEFDGDMKKESIGASVFSAFLHCCIRNTFLDELGPEDSSLWGSFSSISKIAYSAQVDHLLVRGDESPFWDNIKTSAREGKASIIASSLSDAIEFLSDNYGSSEDWNWGQIHTYSWITETSKMANKMGIFERLGLSLLSSYFNRGPFPAPGDYETVNVAAYRLGNNFDVNVIPEMRLVVDFSLQEPMFLVNSTGQSDNPSSPHYDDGIHKWLKGEYQPFPFKDENIKRHYKAVLTLKPVNKK